MIGIILFDWGGVLAPDAIEKAARIFSMELGIDEGEFLKDMDDWSISYSKGESTKSFYENLEKKYGVPANIIEMTERAVPPWEVFGIAKDLKKKGYTIGILSNQVNPRTDSIRNTFDISFFDYAFFSNEVGLMKPYKNFFEYALREMGVDAENCLFVDDHEENTKTAEKLGFKTILFKDISSFKQELIEFLKE